MKHIIKHWKAIYVLIILLIILLTACDKRSVNPEQIPICYPQPESTIVSSIFELEENYLPENQYEEFDSESLDSITIDTYLEFIFKSLDYRYEIRTIADKEMIFAYLDRPLLEYNPSARTRTNVFHRAVILDIEYPFKPLFYVSENKLITPTGNVLWEPIEIPQYIFFGWDITIHPVAFRLNYVANGARDIIDGVSIFWDTIDKEFKIREPDRSQW